ncbi:L-idonate 5-dehydrogenase [Rhodovulum sulfidophilum]|uniref:L-idonate 5-dehydrogenase n=1 Tax=Rhodovulum sulfidophilum TaxID=35806 RepID=A0A0D6B188_RHOSU|nr:L-idonate 5-dehydrogenase [Rhodovulum sulfidophilum]MBK5923168.1 L-idonate 5-dehydrogenase [Rhodovulum sulfidophilum]MBL3553346.1 L-idonate 5-dehydrogenase [Rhodovulum sulfidophilum]MBL3561540.1 L-idonate 5-dehydrogenase [Rhodovulum sulfidophilum]MBL3564955.1 L-idonate 5-dehydrogenase [Rhodovulum sulfidophilum]MBL3575831.1 L-idonate 5-dehydrogenase [Rhodovulum sulfidophilum]
MDTRVCRLHAPHDIRIETLPLDGPAPGEVLVAVGAGGICGSDLHYYHDGGFGPVRVREPIVLGHEAAGTVIALGAGVSGLTEGQMVALNPSQPCGTCLYCQQGMFNHCLEMRFRGSAMRVPHEQGLFRDRIAIGAAQCVPVGPGISLGQAACSEPLAVCLHARRIAGDLTGKTVLVTGAGPIGALCAAVATEGGAAEVVVTDLQDVPLEVALQMGASRIVNIARDPAALEAYAADKGRFDVVFECSAAAPAIAQAIATLRPRGIFVQVGVAGETPVPLNLIVGKEIQVRGTHRFHPEFAEAVAAISSGRIDVRPMISASFPLEDAEAAFEAAGDRTRAVKVHLSFEAP